MSIDPALQMFISACCAKCLSTSCDGALDIVSRAKCAKYAAWQKLPGDQRSKLFLAAMAGELINLERITRGY